MKKVLIATQKPFAKKAVEQIKEICKRNNYEPSTQPLYPT